MNSKLSAQADQPKYRIGMSQINSTISINVGNELLVKSQRVLVLHEQDHSPIYYFPREDVRLNLMRKTDKVTYCPYKGDANHWALNIKGTEIEDAAWSYENPFEQVIEIQNFIAFYPELSQYITLE